MQILPQTVDLTQFQSTPDLINRENQRAWSRQWALRSFQSTPDLINRENIRCGGVKLWEYLFQSTPDLINRENQRRDKSRHKHTRFNPLPI